MIGVNRVDGWHCLPGQRVSPYGLSFIALHTINGQIDALDYSDDEKRLVERVAINKTRPIDKWIIGADSLKQYLKYFDDFYKGRNTNGVQQMAEASWGRCIWAEPPAPSPTPTLLTTVKSMTKLPRLKLADGWYYLDGKHLADGGGDLYYSAAHITDGQVDALDCSSGSMEELVRQVEKRAKGAPGYTWTSFLLRVDDRYRKDSLPSIREKLIAQYKILGKDIVERPASGTGVAVGFALLAAAGLAAFGRRKVVSQKTPRKQTTQATEPATKKS